MALRSLLASALTLVVAAAAAGQTPSQPDPIGLLVGRVQDTVLAGDRAGLSALEAADLPGPSTTAFWRAMSPRPDRLIVKERDRTPMTDGTERLLLEVFSSIENEARVGTWDARVRSATPGDAAGAWRIVSLEPLSTVTGLHRLSLDPGRQFAVHHLSISAPDLTIAMASGSAFVAAIPDGVTALVLVGRGTMRFAPADDAERTQLRLFAGTPALDAEFDIAMLRVNAAQFQPVLDSDMLRPQAVVPGDLRRATAFFEDQAGLSLTLDLNDLSRDRWSLQPDPGDFIAEVRTRKLGGLTYARLQSEAEDVTLFDRRRRKNISLYASADKLAARGRFYNEDDSVDYDVESYDIDTDIDPDRFWIEGRTSLVLRTTTAATTSLTLKIAEPLAVRSIVSDEYGRLMSLRIVGQNSVIVNLPDTLRAGSKLTLHILYSGRLISQDLYTEAVQAQGQQEQDVFIMNPEPRFIYSTRSYWYPQSPVSDYATARIRISVPQNYDVVASGAPAGSALIPSRPGERPRRAFTFTAARPARYLACMVTRLDPVTTADIDLPTTAGDHASSDAESEADPAPAAARVEPLSLVVEANPRQVSFAREVADRTSAILGYYTSILGDAPYPGLTVAVSESNVPGGHSPAYLAILNQTLPTSPLVWRNDPVSFSNYPTYFLAHEVAHQWWGQGVGWKNYHEQWISEGFAQYFAALYAAREKGPAVFEDMLRQMQRSSIDAAAQGPISLGYRLGHIKSDGRVFRAVVYNKSAMVLHMLRRIVGDEAFFAGVRRFYQTWRFRKAGTDDFRVAMEAATGHDLTAFVEGWILGTSIPRIKVTRSVADNQLTVAFEQLGDVLPVPVTVRLVYTNGTIRDVVVPVVTKSVTKTIPLEGQLRDVKIDDDHAALAIFEK